MTLEKDLNASLENFLERWTIDKVKEMTLEEYVGIGDKDTFCQWVETKTRILGSIKGLTSIKFGIYKRRNPNRKPKLYINDKEYSWLKGYDAAERNEVFEKVKKDIIRIIHCAETGKFNEIDRIKIPDLFKWKVAFLYSNERLIPVFKKKVLIKVANFYGIEANKRTKISKIQEKMIQNKPSHYNVYEFMWDIFKKFGSEEEKEEISSGENVHPIKKRRLKRVKTNRRDTEPQERKITRSYIAQQKHNKIQEALKHILIKEYGEASVVMEENFVDIKLIDLSF